MSRTAALELSNGMCALVDEEDLPGLAFFTWYLSEKERGYCRVLARIPGSGDPGVLVSISRMLMDAGVGQVVDHINGCPMDNRRANLRLCTDHQNSMNRRGVHGTSSKFKGVTFRKSINRYRAYIDFDGKKFHLGHFQGEEDAARAYDAKARELHGEFARLNFPGDVARKDGVTE